jgi:fumarylacetoacetase
VSDSSVVDATNDPSRRSWLESANAADCDFPIQNLPFAVFRRRGSDGPFRGGVAIGDQVLDLGALADLGDSAAFQGDAARGLRACSQPDLNAFMQLGPQVWQALRHAVFESLLAGAALQSKLPPCLVPQSQAEYSLPARIGDFTDFYASIHHATAVGRMFRPDNPLLPNYKWVPIGYHGRSSSIVVSGQDVRRPQGQRLPPGQAVPLVGPSARLDFELEMGIFVGMGNPLGTQIPMSRAESHVFGLCLLNDWSARDLQAWEYQPLGPFLAKNFATTISPWIVSLQALAPFRTAFSRPAGDPLPLPYLDSDANRAAGGIDIRLEALLQTAEMRERGAAPQRLSSTSFRHSYWTVAQLVSHHTVNGCNLIAGDLLGTGTQSGPAPEEAGSLLELSGGGTKPIEVGNGERRAFLEDGDTLILRGWCEKPGAVRLGFGEARGRIVPSQASAASRAL